MREPYLIFPGNAEEMQLHWQLDDTADCAVE